MNIDESASFDERLEVYGKIIAEAFHKHKLPVLWGLAIAATENPKFRTGEVNLGKGDFERGGAWGLMQMTLQTAREFAPQVTTQDLVDPHKNASIAAMLCARLARRFKSIEDIASAYNSGKPLAKAPRSTREKYVPRLNKNLVTYADLAARLEQALDEH